MTTEEIYVAIGKSNQEKAYRVVYDINNDKIEDAVIQIQRWYQCNKETAMEVASLFKARLNKIDNTSA